MTRAFLLLFMIGLLSCCSCSSEGAGKKMAHYKIPDACNFDEVWPGYSPNPCSPVIIVPEYEGLLINAAKAVPFTDGLKVKLACTYAFSLGRKLGVLQPVENAIVFTVVDKATNQPYSGQVPDIDHKMPPPGPPDAPMKPEELAGQFMEGYINLDLVQVARMPKKPGKYLVYATVSNFKSNVVEFEVTEPRRK